MTWHAAGVPSVLHISDFVTRRTEALLRPDAGMLDAAMPEPFHKTDRRHENVTLRCSSQGETRKRHLSVAGPLKAQQGWTAASHPALPASLALPPTEPRSHPETFAGAPLLSLCQDDGRRQETAAEAPAG